MTTVINLSAQTTLDSNAENESMPKVSMLAYGGGPINVTGFKLPVIIDLEGVQNLGNAMPLFFNHSVERIVGHGVMNREGNTLTLSGVVSANNADSQQVVSLSKAGFPWKASVGARVLTVEELKSSKSTTVNGQLVHGPMIIARQTFVFETSFVAVPADSTTSATVAANGSKYNGEVEMNFAAWLSEKGFVQADLTESATGALQAMYSAEGSDKQTTGVDEVLASARAREKRHAAYGSIIQAAIDRGLATEDAERLVQAAKDNNMGESEFELQVLRLSRPQGGAYRTARAESPELIEAAVARATGDRDVLKAYRPEVLEASEQKFKHGLSVVELLTMSARQNGYTGISHRDLTPLLRAAFDIRASGPSTYSVGGILSNVANKMITAGFMSVESEWRKLAAIKPVNDLKQYTSYSLTGDFTYKEVGKQGELKHATMGEQPYTNQAKTYGRLFAITRTDLINDDLGAFTRVRTMLGRGAALKLNIEFWTKFLAGVASGFWHADNGNKLTGAGSALSIDGLNAASAAFGALVDPDGNPLGVTPSLLIVPRALEVEATKLVRDTEIRVSGASSKTTYTTGNPHAGKYELVASSYLNVPSIANGSATHSWLAADPMDLPTIEVAFLYGREMPTIESADADFDTLGVQLRGFHDFGVALQEKRASVYSTGA